MTPLSEPDDFDLRGAATTTQLPKDTRLVKILQKYVLPRYVLTNIRYGKDGNHLVQWTRVAGTEFRDPFFDATVARVLARAQQKLRLTTTVESLLHNGSLATRLRPNGFIFHIARCGSTLLSNMLNSIDEHFVLAEPRLPSPWMVRDCEWTREQCVELIRASINVLGANAPRTATRYFIKLSNSHTVDVPLIREAFKDVPEIFIYRDPLEVVVSILKNPTISWLWNEELTGLPKKSITEHPVVELAARVAGRALELMCEYVGENTLIINYHQLGPSTPELLMEHFGIPKENELVTRMLSTLTFYSKSYNRHLRFVEDSELKQHEARPAVRDAVNQYAMPFYHKLERIRLK